MVESMNYNMAENRNLADNMNVIENTNEEQIDSQVKDILELQKMYDELTEILTKYSKYPLPFNIVEKISYLEREFYRRMMTDDVLKKLNDEIELSERFEETANSLVLKVNEMWDNNVSEEDIKTYIYEKLKEIFSSYEDNQIRFLTDTLFNSITCDKNVRVNLTVEQIKNLKRGKGEKGTCGTCLEDYNEDEEIIILHCEGKHAFHPNCIEPWLKLSVHCPTCRYDLRKI
jgi:hypothetical protein